MDVWVVLQAVGAIGFLVSLVPQFFRTLHRRRAEDVSLGFLILVLFASVVLLPYTAHTGQWFFFVSFLGNVVVWGTVCYYRLFPADGLPPKA